MSLIRRLLLIVALLAVAVLLNPSADRHRDRIAASLAERSQLAAVLGLGKLTAFVSSYRSLGVASYTTVQQRVVSVGAFGWVYVLQ